ncbi:MAG: alpha/beta hydrolase [Erysipelotrichaceae bacterium]|nr:alpha/beta hydrolase [Erysipelotrichaceae bacterium]
MKQKTFKLDSKYNDVTLVGTLFEPDGDKKGIVQIVHGMAEHRKRYYEFMLSLMQAGYVVVIHDHRGHGDSVNSMDDYGYFHDNKANAIVEDAFDVMNYVRQLYSDLKLYLFGHSMGSLVVRKMLQKDDQSMHKLIICGSPSYNPMTPFAISMTQIIAMVKGDRYRSEWINEMALGAGNKKFKEETIKNCWLTRDQKVVQAYNEDPMDGFIFTTNGFLNLFRLMKDVYRKRLYHPTQRQLPILFIAGSDDPVIVSKERWIQSQRFLRKVGYQNIQGKLYLNMRHEILNELGKEKVYQDVIDWLDKK